MNNKKHSKINNFIKTHDEPISHRLRSSFKKIEVPTETPITKQKKSILSRKRKFDEINEINENDENDVNISDETTNGKNKRKKYFHNNDIDSSDHDMNQDHDNIWSPLSNYIHPDISMIVTHHNNNNLVSSDVCSNYISIPQTNKKDMVSASTIKNYLINDPILDWLDIYYNHYGLGNTKPNNNTREEKKRNIQNSREKINILLRNGLIFENTVVEEMKRMYPKKYVQIADSTFNRHDDNERKIHNQKTFDSMKSGIPIIFQAVLINDESGLWGIADILIRSDFINKIWKNQLDEKLVNIKSPYFNHKYHYRVIDIKWTTLHLCADGKLIRNSERIPAYKGQLAIYNYIMGNLQGYYPSVAYVMGHAWKYETCGLKYEGNSCFDRLGEICYEGFDKEYISRTMGGIRWIRNVRTYGKYWDLLNPCNENLYPNMSNKNDAPWSEVKKQIANETMELTELWMVGTKNRKIAHENGIYKWNDERCKSSMLGIYGSKVSKTLDKIIEINNNNKGIKILPNMIINNDMNWQMATKYDMFIDFETVNECFMKEPVKIGDKTESNIIFMIGCGYSEDNIWKFKQFTVKELTLFEEQRIIDQWKNFVMDHIKKINSFKSNKKKEVLPRFFHWSNAEVTSSNIANLRHNLKWEEWFNDVIWIDLYKIFTDEPIVINGALRFKLKDVAKNMYKHGMIKTVWNENGVSDGLTAMIDAINYYRENKFYDPIKELSNDYANDNKIDSIRRYNEIDCKVMWEIINYLRTNHVTND